MEYNVLSRVRYFVPGAMLYVLAVWVCWATQWCELSLPSKWQDIVGLAIAAVFAFPYHASNLRNRMNQSYFDAVNQNLVHRLTAPFANDPAVPNGLTWQQIRPAFYNLVNADAALTHQSKRAFRNGAAWTSAADLRAISLIGVEVFCFVLLVGNLISAAYFPAYRAVAGILGCLLLFLLSFFFSETLTSRQIAIGNEQVEHIMLHHRQHWRNILTQIQP
jgi:hypothetical protein